MKLPVKGKQKYKNTTTLLILCRIVDNTKQNLASQDEMTSICFGNNNATFLKEKQQTTMKLDINN
jgi:hypothetical protein